MKSDIDPCLGLRLIFDCFSPLGRNRTFFLSSFVPFHCCKLTPKSFVPFFHFRTSILSCLLIAQQHSMRTSANMNPPARRKGSATGYSSAAKSAVEPCTSSTSSTTAANSHTAKKRLNTGGNTTTAAAAVVASAQCAVGKSSSTSLIIDDPKVNQPLHPHRPQKHRSSTTTANNVTATSTGVVNNSHHANNNSNNNNCNDFQNFPVLLDSSHLDQNAANFHRSDSMDCDNTIGDGGASGAAGAATFATLLSVHPGRTSRATTTTTATTATAMGNRTPGTTVGNTINRVQTYRYPSTPCTSNSNRRSTALFAIPSPDPSLPASASMAGGHSSSSTKAGGHSSGSAKVGGHSSGSYKAGASPTVVTTAATNSTGKPASTGQLHRRYVYTPKRRFVVYSMEYGNGGSPSLQRGATKTNVNNVTSPRYHLSPQQVQCMKVGANSSRPKYCHL